MQLGAAAKIGIGWAIIVAGGVSAFVFSKRSIERQRYEHMKIRERIKYSNFGEYEESTKRYSG